MSVSEYSKLMDFMMGSYGDDIMYKLEVGKALSGESIYAYTIFQHQFAFKSAKAELAKRESILLTGVHHARELTTISTVVFEMLALLYRYEAGDVFTMDLLERAAVVCIPIVNVDGVNKIDKLYRELGELHLVRKNDRQGS